MVFLTNSKAKHSMSDLIMILDLVIQAMLLLFIGAQAYFTRQLFKEQKNILDIEKEKLAAFKRPSFKIKWRKKSEIDKTHFDSGYFHQYVLTFINRNIEVYDFELNMDDRFSNSQASWLSDKNMPKYLDKNDSYKQNLITKSPIAGVGKLGEILFSNIEGTRFRQEILFKVQNQQTEIYPSPVAITINY